jgi:hypothetical protein
MNSLNCCCVTGGSKENNWQGNCSVGQVINSPEILCTYTAHPSTIADNISAADIM